MQEIKENIRQQLYGFYIAYDLWLSNGAKPGGVFSQSYGLCANLFDYLTLIGAPSEAALEQLHADFRSAGLNEMLPFNESKEHYQEERRGSMCHMNPARAAWVRAQTGQAAPVAEVRGWSACRAAMLHAGNFRENANSSTNNFREIAETSTNSSVIPGEVLSAILKFARVRADFDDFDGDRRGIGDCLDEAEQELIVTINKYVSQLAAEPIATNDVREKTAVLPVPVIQADVAQAIEKLKRKLVECNRYNYCADAVKGVEDASRVLALQNQNMSAPITPEAIENAIEYISSIAFHIDEDDYHDKHIAYFMRQALAWLEGHSCSEYRQGKADNQPASGNQVAEFNNDNEWTGNPDIDNAIIMLDRIDTLESCDDDRIEAIKAVLRRLAGNSPVTPDAWISCSERMPDDGQEVVVQTHSGWRYIAFYESHSGLFYDSPEGNVEYVLVTHWMPLPEPPQEVK